MGEMSLELLNFFNVQIVLVAAVLCGIIKDKQGVYFSLSLFLFYAFSFALDDWFKMSDPLYVWRYVRWTLFDLAFLGWLLFLAKKKLISIYVLFISATIEFVAILMLAIRMLDGFYSDAELTTPIFGTVIWATNICYVVLALSPVLQFLVRRSLKCN